MFKFDRAEMQRIAGAVIGAIILSATAVSAAVGPARAVETAAYSAPAPDQADV